MLSAPCKVKELENRRTPGNESRSEVAETLRFSGSAVRQGSKSRYPLRLLKMTFAELFQQP